MLWTDEAKMDLFGHPRYKWEKKSSIRWKSTMLAFKHGGELIILWGCVTASSTGITAKVDGRMDSTKYSQILVAIAIESVKKPKLY